MADQQATMHAWLSDRYGAWNLGLTIASLVSSAVLLAFVFASDFVQRTTGVSADAYQWVTGLVAIVFFCVTLVGLVWQPAGPPDTTRPYDTTPRRSTRSVASWTPRAVRSTRGP